MATSDCSPPIAQDNKALQFAADSTPLRVAPTACVEVPSARRSESIGAAKLAAVHAPTASPTEQCFQTVTVSVFFDGTGNNYRADVGTMQHSNVARLYQAHLEDNDVTSTYVIYVPGLGTFFEDVKDPGDTTFGKAFGDMGRARLDWAHQKVAALVAGAAARAMNPSNRIRSICINVFGFSRGATAARAFVRELAERHPSSGGQHFYGADRYPLEVGFLGVFDTVASVGVPMSGNTRPIFSISEYQSRLDRQGFVKAFGKPGADPAPGIFDGHASWAKNLRIPAPALVKCGLHLIAGHEFRNSFPVDSALDGVSYPSGITEMVLPGAHSDVGGGYQPGEGQRCPTPGSMLSLVALRIMHERARQAKVPLRSLEALAALSSESVPISFALDPTGSIEFAEQLRDFKAYMRVVGSGRSIGDEMLAHSSWWYKWRFFDLNRRRDAPSSFNIRSIPPGPSAAELDAHRRQQAAVVEDRKKEYARTLDHQLRAEQRFQAARVERSHYGTEVPAWIIESKVAAAKAHDEARKRYLEEEAVLDTAADDSTLSATRAVLDERLLWNAIEIDRTVKLNPTYPLRPHYKNLLEAYRTHFVDKQPLDPDVVEFFDRSVHDSLAGFGGSDVTLPSDPRVVYVGGDIKYLYAAAPVPSDAASVVAT